MLCSRGNVSAQENHVLLTVDSLFAMTERNSLQLEASRQKMGISKQNTAIEKQDAYLPELNASASVGYISNAHVWDNHYNYMETVIMPHTSMDFSLAAGYTVFNGGKTRNKLAQSKLEEQIAALDYQKNKEDIQFLLLARYLDLFTLYNQKKVYQQNIALAEQRLSNIQKLVAQGMLTHNDVVRSQLQLTDLKLQLTEVNNNARIANHDLNIVIGLPENTVIDVDTVLYQKTFEAAGIQTYLDSSRDRLPEIQVAQQQQHIAEKQINIARSERLPQVSLFATDAIARPFLYSIPPIDIFMHYAMAGVRVQYNVASLYTSKRRIEKAKMNYKLAETQTDWLEQKSTIDIHNAYIKMQEAWEKYHSLEESYDLAKDNYRVVEQKYLNKFSVITDMLDASTALLSSQLNLNNARISTIYQWFNLMKTSGNWDEK
ncbi:TolC family protein [Chitinophaga costaii]|nr:TolC family protein [Chitinophaga costaii]